MTHNEQLLVESLRKENTDLKKRINYITEIFELQNQALRLIREEIESYENGGGQEKAAIEYSKTVVDCLNQEILKKN
jgi:hypothetical protein